MILFYSLIINFLILFIFFIIGSVFNNFKFLNNSNKKILFGFSLFVIINYFLFFTFYLTVEISLLFLFFTIFLLIIYYYISKKNINFKKFYLDIYKYILPVGVFYVFAAIIYGEQFYVFRGNHWDLFSYLSIASLFNEASFDQVIAGNFPNYFYHFQDIDKLSFSRPLTSYLLGLFINIKVFDIYLLVFLFKTLFIILSSISISNLINEINIVNHKEKYFLSIVFPFSFWLIYIFEIDALSHLVSLPFFILVISETFYISKYVKKNDSCYLFYFSIINSALFLIYPEIFIFSSLILLVCLCVEIYENKSLTKKYLKYFFKVLLIFLALTLFAFKTNYIFLYDQSLLVLSNTKDWWGYFGAFIFGKDSLVLDRNNVLIIEEFVSKNNIFNSLNYIINLHLLNGYNFFYFNILPSLLGLYHLTIGKIENFYSYIHLFFLLILSYFLIVRVIKNFVVLKSSKKIIVNCIFFLFVFAALLLNENIWSIIKLYFFLSPFLFLFLVFKFEKVKKKFILKTNYSFIILLILFPIYKYSLYNDGIGRLDSFPSILNSKIKSNFLWEIELDRLEKCNYIKLNVDDYFKKSYLILKLNHYFSNNIFDKNKNENIENKNICKIKIKENKFIYEN